MNKNLGLVAVIIIAILVAYFVSTRKQNPQQEEISPAQMMNEVQTQEQPAESQQVVRDPLTSGKWRSNTDTKFTREFKSDGTVTDRYEGNASEGKWQVIDPATEIIPNVPAENLLGMTVIKLEWNGGEKAYFTINSLSETSLTTTELNDQGSTTTYTKIQ